MQTEKLTQGLMAKFEQSRIVFWYDDEQSFIDEISQLSMENVSVLNMGQESSFEVKKRIEIDEPEQQFLLYFTHQEPAIEDDWLLDIRLYSQQFYADASSILLNELGITSLSLRAHLNRRKAFFSSKKRTQSLKRLIVENETELTIDQKMITVLSDVDSSNIGDILLQVFSDYADKLTQPEDSLIKESIKLINKFGLGDSFWQLILSEYGYDSQQDQEDDEKSLIHSLLLTFFCTELYFQIDTHENDKQWLKANVINSASGRARVMALLTDWRDSRRFSAKYAIVAKAFEQDLEIASNSHQYSLEALSECQTFESIEQEVIRKLVADLLLPAFEITTSQFEQLISKRKTSYWCHSNPHYIDIYLALNAARILFTLRHSYQDGFHYQSTSEMYAAYTEKLFHFDQNYRKFNEYARKLSAKGADILRQLSDTVEDLYVNWFIYNLGLEWDRLLEQEQSLTQWKIDDIPLQRQFYQTSVQSTLNKTQIKRVFVIISDALRYEVADELSGQINQEKRFKADLSSQLGVLPSYTQLGMAALLPHEKLEYQPDKGSSVWLDGRSSAGIDKRSAILSNVNGLAVTAKELLGWSNEEGRDKVREKSVVYIYHNVIDAIGDKAETEEQAFSACRTAIDELNDLVSRVINRLNGSRLFITADHGFLFRQKAMEQTDKTELPIKLKNPIEAKKRYILGTDIPSHENCWHGRVSDSAGSNCKTEFLLPKNANRFHFVGGARFVHGGAMLQEICVPVITVSGLRDKRAEQHAKKKVDVVVVGAHIKIVSNIDKVRFIQSDPVGDKFIPRKLKVIIVDGQRNPVSSEEHLIFDSASNKMDERSQEARIKLTGSGFDRKNDYQLLLIDEDNNTEYGQYKVTIDLAIQDDFF